MFVGLVLNKGKLEINGFNSVFDRWLARKQKSFADTVKTLQEDAEKRKQLEQQIDEERWKEYRDKFLKEIKMKHKAKPITDDTIEVQTYNEGRAEILPRMDQTEEKVWDSADRRWIRCKICGRIDVSEAFSKYGGPHEETLGICRRC